MSAKLSPKTFKFRAWMDKRMWSWDELKMRTMVVMTWDGLMQFTGLQDRFNVDIYEGDLIHRQDDNRRCVVKWSKLHAKFYLLPTEAMKLTQEAQENFATSPWHDLDDLKKYYYTVLGNIYENPRKISQPRVKNR